MKKMLTAIVGAALLSLVSSSAFAEETKTIKGMGMCAKCELKETKGCINAIQVKEGDKKVTYYLVHNDVSKAFHKHLCSATEKVVATGKVKEVDGKKQLEATKIELDK
jgi:RecG-like helicase